MVSSKYVAKALPLGLALASSLFAPSFGAACAKRATTTTIPDGANEPGTSPTATATASSSTAASSSTSTSKAPAAAAATSASASTSTSASTSGTKYLMIFGDSYSSDGFWAGSNTPTSAQPLGVALPGSTTDGGLNWVGYTATELNTSLVLAYDFAAYGATTDSDIVYSYATSLVGQVAEFEEYVAHNASSTAAWTADDTMAVVWMGINDVGNAYWDGEACPVDEVLDRYFAQLQDLYDAGIRYFTLFTIPPLEKVPAFIDQTAAELAYIVANYTAYNEELETRLASFGAENSDVTGQVFNTSASFYTALDDPSAYGASDATCTNGDGTTCLWYDTYHPGQAIQKLVATNFVDALTGTFF